MMFPMLLRRLGLTPDQSRQVRDIMEKHRPKFQALFTEVRAANEAMASRLFSPGTVTAAELDPSIRQVASLREQLRARRCQRGARYPCRADARAAREGGRHPPEAGGAAHADEAAPGRPHVRTIATASAVGVAPIGRSTFNTSITARSRHVMSNLAGGGGASFPWGPAARLT